MIEGIDVYNPTTMPTGWQSLPFVIHKATEGVGYADASYANRRAAYRGYVWGAYHAFRGNIDGTQQAQFFLNTAKPGPGTVLALDFEQFAGSWASRSNQQLASTATAFILTVQAKAPGNRLLIYCNRSDYANIVHPFGLDNLCDGLWIATLDGTFPSLPWTICQYADTNGLDRDRARFAAPENMATWAISRATSSGWHPIDNVDNTVWIQGRAPVLALEKRPYPSATQPTTADMRKVPADHCADSSTGITQDWADYIFDLFAAIPWDSTGTWADEFDIIKGTSYGSTHYTALARWGRVHGAVRPGGDDGDWALLWGSLQGQIHG